MRFDINPGPTFVRGVATTKWQDSFLLEVMCF
jgi:hypothetical protein